LWPAKGQYARKESCVCVVSPQKLVVIGWFSELHYGVVASEGNFYISVFEQVGDPPYVWGGKG
jgi:hypothetical protein